MASPINRMTHVWHALGFGLHEGYRRSACGPEGIVASVYFTEQKETKKVCHRILTNAYKTTPLPINEEIHKKFGWVSGNDQSEEEEKKMVEALMVKHQKKELRSQLLDLRVPISAKRTKKTLAEALVKRRKVVSSTNPEKKLKDYIENDLGAEEESPCHAQYRNSFNCIDKFNYRVFRLLHLFRTANWEIKFVMTGIFYQLVNLYNIYSSQHNITYYDFLFKMVDFLLPKKEAKKK